MKLSKYHEKYANLSDEDIKKRLHVKEGELVEIFKHVSLNTDSDPVRIAVFGCPDRRMAGGHKDVFEKVLLRKVEVMTYDITIEHLAGEQNIFLHDCTLPLSNNNFDITYAHVLLKFIEPDKQYDVIKNSYEALKIGGVAIHGFDWEEINAAEEKMTDGYWRVPLAKYKEKLRKEDIEYEEIDLIYGPALVLKK